MMKTNMLALAAALTVATVSHAQELRDRYRVQLDLYARALHQITGKAVREKIIYALSLHEMIVL